MSGFDFCGVLCEPVGVVRLVWGVYKMSETLVSVGEWVTVSPMRYFSESHILLRSNHSRHSTMSTSNEHIGSNPSRPFQITKRVEYKR
jgi:hypothetical protein